MTNFSVELSFGGDSWNTRYLHTELQGNLVQASTFDMPLQILGSLKEWMSVSALTACTR